MAKECALSTGKLPLVGLPRNSVARIFTDRHKMISAVYHGRKASTQPTNQAAKNSGVGQTATMGRLINALIEPRCEKTGFLHMRKQRCRSAAQ